MGVYLPFRSSLIVVAGRRASLGRSPACYHCARRWAHLPSGPVATLGRTREMRPFREMQPHTPAISACSAQGLSRALRFRSQLAELSLRSKSASFSLALSALHPFPQHHFRSLAAPASSWLSPLVRCRPFGSNAHALPAYVVLGSPARTAIADGSSLPTTARPSSHVTLPATDDGRGHAGYARRRDSLRLPPPP